VSPPPPPPHTIFLPPDALFLLFLSISRLPRYYEDVQGIMFVVDAADPRRFAEAKDALVSVVNHQELAKKPLIVFSNKMDLRHAGTGSQVAKQVGLNDLSVHLERAWRLQGCSAITGEGVDDGVKWMISQVKAK